PVGHRLQQPERPNPVRPEPVLDAPEPLAFENRRQREEPGKNNDDRRDRNKRRNPDLPRGRKPRHHRVLQHDEKLVESVAHHVGAAPAGAAGLAAAALALASASALALAAALAFSAARRASTSEASAGWISW